MRVNCVSCNYEINLDHEVFNNYSGPIKCYSCGEMMTLKTKLGMTCFLLPSENFKLQISEKEPRAAAL